MKIVITNTVALNGGDAAILIAAMRLLREAFGEDCNIVVVDDHSLIAQRYYPDIHFEQNLYQSSLTPGFRSIAQSALRHVDRDGRRQSAVLSRRAKRLLGLLRRVRIAEAKARMVKAVLSGGGWGMALLPKQTRDTLAAYQRADLVVSTGGTYLVEHYDLAPRLLEFDVARALGIPLIFFTQSLGPFQEPRIRRRLTPHFTRSPLVLVRDERSQRHLRELGVSGDHVRVHSDSVFALGSDESARRIRQRRLPQTASREGPRVCVSVRSWSHFHGSSSQGMQRYRRAVATGVEHLVRSRNARVEFLSTCQGIPEYWRDDAKTALRIHAELAPDVRARVRVNTEPHTPDQLASAYASADYVIATRMHAAILALVAGTVALAIAYEFKTHELFDRLQCADFCMGIDEVNERLLLEGIERFTSQIDQRREHLAARVLSEIASARAVVPLLQAAMGRKRT